MFKKIKKQIAIIRFEKNPTVERARSLLACQELTAQVALSMLKLMSRRVQPGLLFWPQALLEILKDSKMRFNRKQADQAYGLFFQWLNDVIATEPNHSLEKLYCKENSEEVFQVYGRRRLWHLAIHLTRQLVKAGVLPSETESRKGQNGYGSELCMIVFEYEKDPVGLSRRLQWDWQQKELRQWSMAISALPKPWLADLIMKMMEEAPHDNDTFFKKVIGFNIAVRACSQSECGEDTMNMLSALQLNQDVLILRLFSPPSSTCLWESVDQPPALDTLIHQVAHHSGWPQVLPILKSVITIQAHLNASRASLAHQISITCWEDVIAKIIMEIGPPPENELAVFVGTDMGSYLEKGLLDQVAHSKKKAHDPSQRRL